MRLAKLQESDKKTRKFRIAKDLQENKKNVDKVLYHQKLLFILEAIQIELISQYYCNWLNSVLYYKLNQREDAQRKEKKLSHDLKNWYRAETVEKCLINKI